MQTKAETIFHKIKAQAEEINKQLAAIEVYDAFSASYDKLIDEIEAFNNNIKTDAFVGVPPEELNETKKEVYQLLFSSKVIQPMELLCFAQKLDHDELFVCARRAKLLGDKGFLFICNMDFLKEELWNKKIKIDNVKNLGILHHYNAGLTFKLNSKNEACDFVGKGDDRAEYAVKKVFEVIPDFLKDNVKSPSLKVVLRSCSGAQIRGEETLKPHFETIAYPIRLLTPSLDFKPAVIPRGEKPVGNETKEKASSSAISVNTPATEVEQLDVQEKRPIVNTKQKQANKMPENNLEERINIYRKKMLQYATKTNILDGNIIKEKGNICISQDKVGNELITLLHLPFAEKEPVALKNYPELNTVENFKLFAKKLAKELVNYDNLHINPFDISPIIPHNSYAKAAETMHLNGMKQFQEVFATPAPKNRRTRTKQPEKEVDIEDLPLISQWQSTKALPEDKNLYKKLFTQANDVKDVFPLPDNTYSKKLLALIKDTCPNLSLFKCYYGGYKASPNRMVYQVADAEDANHPKGIIVSRASFWGEKKPEAPETPDASAENEQKPTSGY